MNRLAPDERGRVDQAFALHPRPPFSLERTVRALQRLPTSVVDRYEDGQYMRGLATGDGDCLITVAQAGTIDRPRLRGAILGPPASPSAVHELNGTLSRILGLTVDLEPFERAVRGQPPLEPMVLRLRGLHPPRFPTLFEAVANAIPFQQVSLSAAVAIVGRLVTSLGRPVLADGRSGWLFPEPEVVAEAPLSRLRSCGLSAHKAEALRGAALAIAEGSLAEPELLALSSQEAVRRLMDLPGVGPWTAELVLLRGLGRLDVFPSGDVGARRVLSQLLGLAAPLTAQAERDLLAPLGPWRGLLYFYGLGWRLAQRGLISQEAC